MQVHEEMVVGLLMTLPLAYLCVCVCAHPFPNRREFRSFFFFVKFYTVCSVNKQGALFMTALFGSIALTVGTPVLWWYGWKSQKEIIGRLEKAVDRSESNSVTDTKEWVRVSGKLSVDSKEKPIERNGKFWYSVRYTKAIAPVLEDGKLVLVKNGVWRTTNITEKLKGKLLLGKAWSVDPDLCSALEYAQDDPMYQPVLGKPQPAKQTIQEMAKELEVGRIIQGIPLNDDRTWTVYTYARSDGVLRKHPLTVVSPLSHEETLSKHKNNLLATHFILGIITLGSATASCVLIQRRLKQ